MQTLTSAEADALAPALYKHRTGGRGHLVPYAHATSDAPIRVTPADYGTVNALRKACYRHRLSAILIPGTHDYIIRPLTPKKAGTPS